MHYKIRHFASLEIQRKVEFFNGIGRKKTIRRRFSQMPHNLRMHLTCYSGLRPLPPAGDADVRL